MSALALVQFGLSLLAALLGGLAGWWLRGRPQGRESQRPAPSHKQLAGEVLQSLHAAAETVRCCVEQHAECIRTIQSELNDTTSTEPTIITNAARSVISSSGLMQHQLGDIQNVLKEQRQEIHDGLAKTHGLLITFATLDRQQHMYRQVLCSLEVLAAELAGDIKCHEQRLQQISRDLEREPNQSTAAVANAITQILDATDEVQRRASVKEQRLARQAAAVNMQAILTHVDLLTSLPNRRAMEAELRRAAAQATPRAPYSTVLLVDLDGFSRVNTEYGHQGGDLVLRQAADTLKHSVNGRDTVARFGGDKFAILLNRTTLHDALPIADRVRKGLEDAQFSHGTRPLHVTASVGIAQLTLEEMNDVDISRVDAAVHAAQRAGGNVCFRHDGQQCHPVSSVFQHRHAQEAEIAISLTSLWRETSESAGSNSGMPAIEEMPLDSRDVLTGRSLFAANLGRRLSEWRRGGDCVSVAILHVDQMDELVERFGDAGHEFLRQVMGRLLGAATRDMDERCEFEDGLFALLLPGTDKGNALAVAERLRSQVRQCKVRMDSDLWDLSASIGVAHCTVAARVMDIMLSAEAAMHAAIKLGGDAVCVGEPAEVPITAGNI